jgi:hypothetical protein
MLVKSQKSENFRVTKRNITNPKMADNWGNAKNALPLDFYAYKLSIHLIANLNGISTVR